MGGVVDVEIRAGCRPADRDGVLEGEEREAIGSYFAGGTGDWGGGLESGVEMRTGGANEDEERNDLGDEGPSDGGARSAMIGGQTGAERGGSERVSLCTFRTHEGPPCRISLRRQ